MWKNNEIMSSSKKSILQYLFLQFKRKYFLPPCICRTSVWVSVYMHKMRECFVIKCGIESAIIPQTLSLQLLKLVNPKAHCVFSAQLDLAMHF